MSNFKDLPNELLLKIFSHYIRSEGHEKFLRNIPRVCKRWNKLSSDSSLWEDVRARDWKFLLNPSRRGLLYDTKSLKIDEYDGICSGINLSAVLKNIRDLKALDLWDKSVGSDTMKIVAENCPHLESLRLDIEEYMSYRWDQFFTVCGPTLKHLDLTYFSSEQARQQLLSGISAKCPRLEKLGFSSYCHVALFPIYKLQSGCPKLEELEFSNCRLITTVRNDSLGCGFKNLKKFRALTSDFSGLNIFGLLKDSMDLQHLELYGNSNLVFDNISNIPSDKVRILNIHLKDNDQYLEALKDAVGKWRHTLMVLKLWRWQCDISSVLENFLLDNPNPQLKSLSVEENINPHFLEEFIQKCQNFIHLEIGGKEHEGREKIKEALELLMSKEHDS